MISPFEVFTILKLSVISSLLLVSYSLLELITLLDWSTWINEMMNAKPSI